MGNEQAPPAKRFQMETCYANRGGYSQEKRERKEWLDSWGWSWISSRTALGAQQLSSGIGEKGSKKGKDVGLPKEFDEWPGVNPPGHQEASADIEDKNNYVVHYRKLQFYLLHGVKLKKVHRVLEFEQECWMEPYIRMNTEFRKRAANDFEKNFYKLINNSVFGKTIENLRNRFDIKIVI